MSFSYTASLGLQHVNDRKLLGSRNWMTLLQVSADNGSHKVLVEATCERPGTPLRAPTADSGLSPLCKDSFYGKVCCASLSITSSLILQLQMLADQTLYAAPKIPATLHLKATLAS